MFTSSSNLFDTNAIDFKLMWTEEEVAHLVSGQLQVEGNNISGVDIPVGAAGPAEDRDDALHLGSSQAGGGASVGGLGRVDDGVFGDAGADGPHSAAADRHGNAGAGGAPRGAWRC